MIFNDLSSPLAYLQSRRSGRPRDMVEPGPDDATIAAMVADALRSPDHGKLHPWRVIQIGGDQRDALSQLFQAAYKKENPDAGHLEIEAMDNMARMAPCVLTVLYTPRDGTKIPGWEQELSAGAFAMNLLHAAHVRGFVGGWITGWPAFSDTVRDAFGTAPERIAGFLYFGTAGAELEERPRPDLGDVLSRWEG